MGHLQEVRPEFGFRENHQLRLQNSQIWSNRTRKVHGEIENVRFAKALARERLSSIGRSRHQHPVLREASLHLLHQSTNGKHLAEGNRMNPDDAIWAGAL